jgi:hypothetical protein
MAARTHQMNWYKFCSWRPCRLAAQQQQLKVGCVCSNMLARVQVVLLGGSAEQCCLLHCSQGGPQGCHYAGIGTRSKQVPCIGKHCGGVAGGTFLPPAVASSLTAAATLQPPGPGWAISGDLKSTALRSCPVQVGVVLAACRRCLPQCPITGEALLKASNSTRWLREGGKQSHCKGQIPRLIQPLWTGGVRLMQGSLCLVVRGAASWGCSPLMQAIRCGGVPACERTYCGMAPRKTDSSAGHS